MDAGQILGVTVESLRAVATGLSAVAENGSVVVVGSQKTVDGYAPGFANIEKLL